MSRPRRRLISNRPFSVCSPVADLFSRAFLADFSYVMASPDAHLEFLVTNIMKEKARTSSPDSDRQELENMLLADHSRSNTDRIAGWIGVDASRLAALMVILLGSDALLTQRSAWVVSVIADSHPILLEPWVAKLLRKMQEPGIHDALPRAVTRALQWMEIPSCQLGNVAVVCFDLLSAAQTPVAVKANAMTVLARIAGREPDLAREVRLVIEQQTQSGIPAIIARARQVLRSLPA